jgi:hypothetical protein
MNKNGIIYKIVCNDENINNIYIGSTYNFAFRKSHHKYNCNNENDIYLYRFIRENGGWNNWSIFIIRKYENINKIKLRKKERKYINKLNATLNQSIPSRTKKEYNKVYRRDNNAYIKEKIECNCGCLITRGNISRHRKTNKHTFFLN